MNNPPPPPLIPGSGNYEDIYSITLQTDNDINQIEPAGINGNVQINNGGSFGSNGNFNFFQSSNALIVSGSTLSPNALGFFGGSSTKQGTGTYDLQDIINILVNYGLVTYSAGYQQSTKLVGTGVTSISGQGFGIDISADGNTLAVGGLLDNSSTGATWIFIRSAGLWSQQGLKLVGSGGTYPFNIIYQGRSVSLSSDGNTLAIGGPGNSTVGEEFLTQGGFWVFTRTMGTWTQEGPHILGTGGIGNSGQGFSTSLSSDGNTLAIGGPEDDSQIGACWVFIRSAGVWTQQGLKLIGTGAIGPAAQGSCVSLSSDGDTLVFGGFLDNGGIGACWVFTRTAGTWTQQGLKLTGTGYTGSPNQGLSVSLSNDTLAIGGRYDSGGIGACWVFTRTAGTWSQQGSKLVGTGYIGNPEQGRSLILSDSGDILVFGGRSDNSNIGATWVFSRSGGTWTQRGPKIVATGAVGAATQSLYLALSSDDQTLAIGGFTDNGQIGATWIFDAV